MEVQKRNGLVTLPAAALAPLKGRTWTSTKTDEGMEFTLVDDTNPLPEVPSSGVGAYMHRLDRAITYFIAVSPGEKIIMTEDELSRRQMRASISARGDDIVLNDATPSRDPETVVH